MQYQRWALAGALTAAVLLGGCSKPPQQRGAPALDVDVAQAQRRDIATYLSLDGQISPLEQSTLSFQQSGPLTTVNVVQGDRVSAGELLARIDASTLQAQLAQVQAQIAQASAQAQASQLNVPITQSSTAQAVENAKAALANAKLQLRSEQSALQAGLRVAYGAGAGASSVRGGADAVPDGAFEYRQYRRAKLECCGSASSRRCGAGSGEYAAHADRSNLACTRRSTASSPPDTWIPAGW